MLFQGIGFTKPSNYRKSTGKASGAGSQEPSQLLHYSWPFVSFGTLFDPKSLWKQLSGIATGKGDRICTDPDWHSQRSVPLSTGEIFKRDEAADVTASAPKLFTTKNLSQWCAKNGTHHMHNVRFNWDATLRKDMFLIIKPMLRKKKKRFLTLYFSILL